jgi:hypothetical protein
MLDLFESTWRDLWSGHDARESVGAVFTRPEIVDLILDLAGYVAGGERLAARRVLEPSCCDGAFVVRVVLRLIDSEREHASPIAWNDPLLDGALRAADISRASIQRARDAVLRQLVAAGCPRPRALALVDRWFVETDFLLAPWEPGFDLVVGNPPYVRIEDVPRPVLAQYRSLYATTTDRADLYVAFIERGLELLSSGGVLAFITANRFAKNQYGRALRKLIAERFRVRHYLNLEHTQPFLSDVSAYPAILVIDRQRGQPTRAATLESIDPTMLRAVRDGALGPEKPTGLLSEFEAWYPDGAPWVTTCRREHADLSTVRRMLTLLEGSAPGTKVGIGVATGADGVFILDEFHPEIEADRQIPLALARGVANERISWSGHYLLNPFDDAGAGVLVSLDEYPGLGAYLERHTDQLMRRHVARQRPNTWYRTIDRIWPELQQRPKLLIPDIQRPHDTVVGFDPGKLYPHHNLYWITSEGWDLRALKTILRSSFALAQVRAHSVQMRGGSVRWQAQTLRKLRIPALGSISDTAMADLVELAESGSQPEIDAAVERTIST